MHSPLSTLKRFFGLNRQSQQARARFFRPVIESMEDRRLMAVLLVDDNFAADYPAANRYTTIQAAVNAAATPTGSNPGDTIIVRPGLYDESVSVAKRVTIIGAGAPSIPFIGTNPNPNDLSLNQQFASIVDPATGAGFTVSASNVTIQGFTIANFDDSLDTQGIVVSGGTGNKIFTNVIVDNTIGISLATNTAAGNSGALQTTFVTGNTIRNNNTAGAAAGNGIYADAGVRNAIISGNRIHGHENASIIMISTVAATINSNVQIVGNITGDQVTGEEGTTMIFTNLVDSQVNANIFRNVFTNAAEGGGSGIFFGGGSTNVQVIGNNLQDGSYTGINVRYLPGPYAVAVNNSQLLIQGNIVQNFGDGGIRLRDGAFNNIVRSNVTQYNGFGSLPADTNDGFGSGISLEGAINNLVEYNTSYYNDADGFFADLASSGNRLNSNGALFNGEHDYHDDSVGVVAPALTANTYTNNRGRTQNRTGLIRFFS
ncbi:nitrous oxide reductase family maturation protein NosD [Anatilimnocola sp. NA78]|uniref:right-handed parallel beta-helix repeat-containing protein n=1 Tax=Anatilimnocola sp. NA78 TaxID=3415683 RepID=UPI003CE5A40B